MGTLRARRTEQTLGVSPFPLAARSATLASCPASSSSSASPTAGRLSFSATCRERREACPRRHLGLLTSPGDRLLQPGLLALSSGSVEERRADGFGSPVALDGSLAVAGLFGASGTPMAVLVDAEGRVASPLEAGADAVMALARGSSRAAA